MTIIADSVPKRNTGLDLIRAICAIAVVLVHTEFWVSKALGYAPTHFLRPVGFLSVEFFFALSGILLGPILIKSIQSGLACNLRIFVLRRFFRTYPIYIVGLIGYLILDKASNDGLLPFYFIFSQNLVTPSPKFFAVSWSLSIEEWFYLLTPILIFITYKISWYPEPIIRYRIVLLIIIVISILARYHYLSDYQVWDRDLRKTVLERLDAIAIPALLASFSFPSKTLRYTSFIFLPLVFFLMAQYWDLGNKYSDSTLTKAFFLFGFSALPVAIATIILVAKKYFVFYSKLVIFFAEISYPLYVFHILVLIIFQMLLVEYTLTNLMFYYATSILVSYTLHRLIEKPFINLRPIFIRVND